MYQIYGKVDTITKKLTQMLYNDYYYLYYTNKQTSRKMLQKTQTRIKITVFMLLIK